MLRRIGSFYIWMCTNKSHPQGFGLCSYWYEQDEYFEMNLVINVLHIEMEYVLKKLKNIGLLTETKQSHLVIYYYDVTKGNDRLFNWEFEQTKKQTTAQWSKLPDVQINRI